MAKTAKQVQGDVYQLLKDSTLYSMISGEVYRNGYRPRDSKAEDAIVIFTAGLPDQVQTGVVTVNIYVPDIDPYANGVWVENGMRTAQLELLAQQWAESLTAEVSNYRFKLQQTIYTEEEVEIHQHFVVVKLMYEYFGDDFAPLNIPQVAVIDATDADGNTSYLPILETEDGGVAVTTPVIEKKTTNV